MTEQTRFQTAYAAAEPSPAEVAGLPGTTVLEFGAPWCGICRAAQPVIEQALAQQRGVRHLKIEDGSGRPLGRSFGVSLWPTLIVLDGGREIGRVVRPRRVEDVAGAFAGRPGPRA